MKKFTILTLVAIFAMALVGCETTKETNSNKAVVVNSSNVNANIANITNANRVAVNRDDDWDADLTEEEFNKDRTRYEERRKDYDDDSIGQGAKDLWYWTKVRAALAAVDDLRDSTINVDVNNGVVTLRGSVGSAAEKSAAEKAAKVEGVTSVKNDLKVSAGDSMTNQMTSDNKANTNANKK